MFKSYKIVLILLLVVSLNVDQFSCEETYSMSVSWIYRGNALLNNTVLTFNKDDTLNLACAATAYFSPIFFSVTRGTAPPSNINITSTGYNYEMSYSNAQTIIYDDLNGIYDGFENIVVLTKNLFGAFTTNNYKIYMSIGVLRPADTGTYFCTVVLPYSKPYPILAIADAGGVTIQVNTKPGQARSNQANAPNVLTYSAVLLSASKLFL